VIYLFLSFAMIFFGSDSNFSVYHLTIGVCILLLSVFVLSMVGLHFLWSSCGAEDGLIPQWDFTVECNFMVITPAVGV